MDASASTFERGMEALKQGHTEEAIGLFEETVEATPTDARPHEMLGIALSMGGQQERALGEIRRAVALDPGSASAYCNLGLVHERLGQKEEAAAAYHESLRVDPAHRRAQERLAKLSESMPPAESGLQAAAAGPLISLAPEPGAAMDLTAPGAPLPEDLSEPPATPGGLTRVRCPRCQETNLASVSQCYACGAPLQAAGAQQGPATAPVASGPRPAPSPSAEGPGPVPGGVATASRSRGVPAGPVLAGALLLLLAGAGGWWFLFRSTPEKAVQGLHQALVAKDVARAKTFFTEETAEVLPDVLLQQMVSSAKADEPPKVTSTTIKGSSATVSLASGPQMGAAGMTGELELMREKGAWRVDLVGTMATQLAKQPGFDAGKMEAQLTGPAGVMMEQMGLRPLLGKVLERMRQ